MRKATNALDEQMSEGRTYLLDVSRLIWRLWAGRLWTGIDRVCLHYVEAFGDRSLAVVQRRGWFFILSPDASDKLFRLLRAPDASSRAKLIKLMIPALLLARRSAPGSGTIYLNVGHTGLNEPALTAWVRRNKLKAVYLVHDLIPITHPQFCRAGEAEKHAVRITNLLVSAQGVICNSRATLNDLTRFALSRKLAMPDHTVALISGLSLGLNRREKTVPEPYFVILGTIEGRKNHVLLLQVWRRLVKKMGKGAPSLIVIGQRGWKAEAAIAMLDDPSQFIGKVIETGSSDDLEVVEWLSGARALLMPSFTEGFGLPVVEALQCGTPVIVSDLPVYREIASDIPLYLDPHDEQAWETAIVDFTGASRERARQQRRTQSFQAPDWPTHFSIVEEWLSGLGART